MVGKNDGISDTCLCFARNESNENVRISYSNTNSASVDVYVFFTYLENWNKGRGAFILTQLNKQFKLDMVGFDPCNLFVSQRYSFGDGEYKEIQSFILYLLIQTNFLLKIYSVIILDTTIHLIIMNIIIECVY